MDPPGEEVARARADYHGLRSWELSFREGEGIAVQTMHASGWWTGSLNQRTGLFPVSYTDLGGEGPIETPPRGTYFNSFAFEWQQPVRASPSKKLIVKKRQLPPVSMAPPPPPPTETDDGPVSSAATAARDNPPTVPAVVAVPVTGTQRAARGSGAEAAAAAKVVTLDGGAFPGVRTHIVAAGGEPKGDAPVADKRGSKKEARRSLSMRVKTQLAKGRLAKEKALADADVTSSASAAPAGEPAAAPAPHPALRRSSESSMDLRDLVTTKTQTEAAERFKTRMAQIYETGDLSAVRQVFDGMGGAVASESGAMHDDWDDAPEPPDMEPDVCDSETRTSRAALDLCSRSPKVFSQLLDTKAERLRMVRELNAAERHEKRVLQFGEDDASPKAEPPPAALQGRKPSLVQQQQHHQPQQRKRSESVSVPMLADAAVFSASSGALATVTALSPKASRAEGARSPRASTLISPRAKLDSEEVRRTLHFANSHPEAFTESHTMLTREWVAGSNRVPEYKQPSWALVDVKDGEFFFETGRHPPCETVADFGEVLRLEDPAYYRFWARDFYLNARHCYFLCTASADAPAEPKEPTSKPSKPSMFARTVRNPSQAEVVAVASSSSSSLATLTPADTVLVLVRLGDEEKGENSYVISYHKRGVARVQCPHSTAKSIEWFLRKSSPLFKTPMSIFGVRSIVNSRLDRHVLGWERGVVQRAFKFGVVYCRNGQTEEDDIYSNEHGSSSFRDFLALLGNIVPLKDHPGYRGGLNVVNNSTGFLSVYNVLTFNEDGEFLYDQTSNPLGHMDDRERPHQDTLRFNMEIMFHVSTFLPFSPENRQQLNRKRHIGNDVCVVVFKERSNTGLDETGKPLEANLPVPIRTFTSQFNHVFIVVTPWRFDAKGRVTHYKLVVSCKDGVRPHRPYLPKNGIISVRKLSHWLLVKLVNAERASMYARSFSQRESRTSAAMLAEAVSLATTRAQAASGSRLSRSKDK